MFHYSWWLNPSEKYQSDWIISPNRDEHKYIYMSNHHPVQNTFWKWTKVSIKRTILRGISSSKHQCSEIFVGFQGGYMKLPLRCYIPFQTLNLSICIYPHQKIPTSSWKNYVSGGRNFDPLGLEAPTSMLPPGVQEDIFFFLLGQNFPSGGDSYLLMVLKSQGQPPFGWWLLTLSE